MDNGGKSMARKRERHFNESKTVLSVALLLFGICSCFCLVLIWPQSYIINVFNSKLSYHLIMGVEDYFTCNDQYVGFVIDEPDPSYSMFTMFVFNVSNCANVLQRGDKPVMVETGPYGFVKYTYRYEISFDDPELSETVSYKEYSILQTIDDPDKCEEMYFRMDRDLLQASPCSGSACKCKSYDDLVTIVNPLFFKMLNDESSSEIIGQHSVEVFSKIKEIMEDPFTEAVRAHMVPRALKEVFLFRTQMQSGYLMRDAVLARLASGKTLNDIATQSLGGTCGMEKYGLTTCPFNPSSFIIPARINDMPLNNYPSIVPLINATNNLSIMNIEYGVPRLLGVAWVLGSATFNSQNGYSSVTVEEMNAVVDDYIELLTQFSFGSNPTANQLLGARRMLKAFCTFVSDVYLVSTNNGLGARLALLAYDEYRFGHNQEPCDPLGTTCVWQFGYIKHRDHVNQNISYNLALQLIDLTTETSTNPANVYKDLNAPKWYNTYRYCAQVLNYSYPYDISCTNLDTTFYDGQISRPAALWGKDTDQPTDNLTALHAGYKRLSATEKYRYFSLSCNISVMMQDVYRTTTGFHDNFVVRFLNKYKDPDFSHNFTVGNWTDLGVAQFGGGFVTYALVSQRSTYQIVRDGMWRIGPDNYFYNFLEYSTWAARQGYPEAWIYSLDDSRLLLHSLARRDAVGVELRRHIAYQGTTFFGDGVNFIRDVGNIGDRTFTPEANLNSFACTGENAEVCGLLNTFYNSSYEQCQFIEKLYSDCEDTFNLGNIKWIVFNRCKGFQTSATSDTGGIVCDESGIYGEAHPYRKSMGNIVFQMLWFSTSALEFLDGLWCNSATGCKFQDGGMFATTTPRKLLIEGYTDPSMLKFLNLKHYHDTIGFECETDPYDICGVRQHKCTAPGLMMTLPNGGKKLLKYGNTSNEEYFAPYFVVTNDSELLWPFAIDAAVARYGKEKMQNVNYTKVRNPHFAMYPAWTANDTDFNKHYQCQKRFLGGEPDLFNSCVDTLYTGRTDLSRTLQIKSLHGNSTIYPFGNTSNNGIEVQGSTVNNQLNPSLWPGFLSYPYDYLGLTGGLEYKKMTEATIFSTLHGLVFSLYQKTLIFEFQRELTVTMPLKVSAQNSFSPVQTLPARRFVEDIDTWSPYKEIGTPQDSYGMPYQIPKAMASLEHYAKFPIYTSTPHMYLNTKNGGGEGSLVLGTVPNEDSQRTYVDYDPITGRALRKALRQQINIRLEAGPLFPKAFSSQDRCLVPTRIFQGSSGFGCFTYVPVIWFEDARTMDTETFFRLYDHYYTRPDRAATLTVIGIVFGVFFILVGTCLFVNEAYHRRRFKSRVYVD